MFCYKFGKLIMKSSFLLVVALLAFALIIQGCGNNSTSNTGQNGNATAVSASNNNSKSGFGLSENDFISAYNRFMDTSIKHGITNASYYKIDMNKVKNNTIVLDGVATLAWHINEGYLDAVTLTVKNQSTQGLNLCEAGIIFAITGNKEIVTALTEKINSNEKTIVLDYGNTHILRQSDFKINQMEKGTSLLVCTQEYNNNMMNLVRIATEKTAQNNAPTHDSSNNYVPLDDNHNVQSFGHELNKFMARNQAFYVVDGNPIQVLEWKRLSENMYAYLFNDQTEAHMMVNDAGRIQNICLMSYQDNELSKQTLPAKLIATLITLGMNKQDAGKFAVEVFDNPYLEHKFQHREKNRIYRIACTTTTDKEDNSLNLVVICAMPVR